MNAPDLQQQLAAIDMRSDQAEWDRVDALLEAAEVTPPPAHDAAAIAERLTKEQREALLPNTYADRRGLVKLGLAHWKQRPGKRVKSLMPTTLGYAVRASLAQSKGEE